MKEPLEEHITKLSARLAKIQVRIAQEVAAQPVLNTSWYWMDNYWNDAIQRRSATLGEVYPKKPGSSENDDGAIFQMDL